MKRMIAVVEDENSAYENLEKHILRYGEEEGIEFIIERYTSALTFLDQYKSIYAVVFMDIQLPDISGLQAAERMRKQDKVTSLVFVTSLAQYAQAGYAVDAVSYLVKPVGYENFALVLRKALNIYAMREEHDLILELPGGKYKISIERLMYVEVTAHRLYYRLVDDTVEMTGALNAVEKMLAPYGFIRCNSCYLVNPKFVKSVRSYEVEVGSEVLHISRAKRKSFLEELSAWYIHRGNQHGH